MILILRDSSTFLVERPFWYSWRETKGFHHFKILQTDDEQKSKLLIGKRVAIPLSDIKYLTID